MIQLIFGLAAGVVVGLIMEWMIDWSSISVSGRPVPVASNSEANRRLKKPSSTGDRPDPEERSSERSGG